ncbi:MAG: DUF1177 domain-containing protein [Chloroflexota bacterium]|nr:DUF1177 domain-containing protein [Chloroflexota bacterium]
MPLKQVLEIWDLLDSPTADGEKVKRLLETRGCTAVYWEEVVGPRGSTDFVKAVFPGVRGKRLGGEAPTLGVVGRLGGVGARPEVIGLVSDADGAIAALALALKLADMNTAGDRLAGDVIIATHVCPDAPTHPHYPVPFMGSPVDMAVMNRHEVDPAMDAILSIDTTKGNRMINKRGFAISPTVKDGYILRAADDLLDIMQITTGQLPAVFALATQDITPYGNHLHHINSILQPSVATIAPVVGVAITAEVPVPGCATGASHPGDVELATRYCLEVAKAFTAGNCRFYDPVEYDRLQTLYGSMAHLRTQGKA